MYKESEASFQYWHSLEHERNQIYLLFVNLRKQHTPQPFHFTKTTAFLGNHIWMGAPSSLPLPIYFSSEELWSNAPNEMNLFDTCSTSWHEKWRRFGYRKLTECNAARCLTRASSDYLLEILFFLIQVKTVKWILIHIISTLVHEISDDKLMVGVSCNVFWLFNSVSSGYRRRVIFRIPKSQTFLGMDERFVTIRKEHSETNHFEWVRWCIIPFCAKRLSEICSSYLWK